LALTFIDPRRLRRIGGISTSANDDAKLVGLDDLLERIPAVPAGP